MNTDSHADNPATDPLVSVIMSNFNGSAYLEAAISSVLDQSHKHLELIVVDDASTDQSTEILCRLAQQDRRLRHVVLDKNTGPAGARNIAVAAAAGDWLAIVDADDLIHPQRIERLLALAQETQADAIADDLLSFGAVNSAGRTLLKGDRAKSVQHLTTADLINSDTVNSGLSSLGYLKPMIRKNCLASLRYNETLRIGEDFDLYCHLLLNGARFVVSPDPTYLYRRHPGSVSHRLSDDTLGRLIIAHETLTQYANGVRAEDDELQTQLARRKQRLELALRYQQLVNTIKQNGVLTALHVLWQHPALMRDVMGSLKDRLRRSISSQRFRRAGKLQTIVLAEPDRLQRVPAPSDALRIPVGCGPAPGVDNWSERRALAICLAKLASKGPIDIIAEGPAGLDALGYVPEWRSTRLAPRHQDPNAATIPQDVVQELS